VTRIEVTHDPPLHSSFVGAVGAPSGDSFHFVAKHESRRTPSSAPLGSVCHGALCPLSALLKRKTQWRRSLPYGSVPSGPLSPFLPGCPFFLFHDRCFASFFSEIVLCFAYSHRVILFSFPPGFFCNQVFEETFLVLPSHFSFSPQGGLFFDLSVYHGLMDPSVWVKSRANGSPPPWFFILDNYGSLSLSLSVSFPISDKSRVVPLHFGA